MVTTRPIFPPYSSIPVIHTSIPNLILRPKQADDLQAFHTLRTQWDVMKYTSKQDIDKTLDETRTWLSRFINLDDKNDNHRETQHQERDQQDQQNPTSTTQSPTDNDHTTKPKPTTPPFSPSENFAFSLILLEDHNGTIQHHCIGSLGCHSTHPNAEIGWMLRTEHWNKSYMSIATQAFMTKYWSLPRQTVDFNPDTQPLDPSPDSSIEQITKPVLKPRVISDHTRAYTDPIEVMECLRAEIEESNIGSVRVAEKLGFEHECDHVFVENGENVKLFVYTIWKDMRGNIARD